MEHHECLVGREPAVVPKSFAEEWTCPDCGKQWKAIRVKHMNWPDGRVPEGADPEALGWRGALKGSEPESRPPQ